jgi:glycosyltransferase involved in cell wall biosynthesis
MPDANHSGLVSVIIPLYNHAHFIKQALESVVAQGEIVKEVIVIDDGSKDDSLSIARAFAAAHPHIKVSSHENRGAAATLNRGVQEATGEFVAILNSDDYWMPERLTRLVRALDLDAGLALAASGISFVDGDGRESQNIWYEQALGQFVAGRDLGLALVDANFLMTTSNFVVRRHVFARLGGFADIRYAHDLDFVLRLAVRGLRIGFIDDKLLAYRSHGTNTIKESHQKVRVDWAIVSAFYLWCLMGKVPQDQMRIQKCRRILDRHRLTKAVDDCVRYFEANASVSLVDNRLIGDSIMKSKLYMAVL